MGERTSRIAMARGLNERLKDLVRAARRSEAGIAKALHEMNRGGLFRALGFSRIADYAESELDLTPAKTKGLLEIARRIEALRETGRAFDEGRLPWTKARLVVRVATAESEQRWLLKAESLSVRGLEDEVRKARGEGPVVRLMFELTPEEAAYVEDLVRRVRERRGEATPRGTALVEVLRAAEVQPIDLAPNRVVIQQCATCAAATRDTPAGPVEVPPAELEAAKADGDVLDLTNGRAGTFENTIRPAVRRAVHARAGGRCEMCGMRAWLHLHHVERRDGDPDVLCALCSSCHKPVVHGGHVIVTGRAPHFDFRLRDGTPAPVRRGGGSVGAPGSLLARGATKHGLTDSPGR